MGEETKKLLEEINRLKDRVEMLERERNVRGILYGPSPSLEPEATVKPFVQELLDEMNTKRMELMKRETVKRDDEFGGPKHYSARVPVDEALCLTDKFSQIMRDVEAFDERLDLIDQEMDAYEQAAFELFFERNDLSEAEQHLELCESLGRFQKVCFDMLLDACAKRGSREN